MSDYVRDKQKGIFRINLIGLGSGLLIFFCLSAFLTAIVLIALICSHGFMPTVNDYGDVIAVVALLENPFFWAGVLLICFGSKELGIKAKVMWIILALVPIIHFAVCLLLLRISAFEYRREKRKLKEETIVQISDKCDTKYPVLLIHGIFFRDFSVLSYWGRIPDALEKNGAKIYYGDHDSCDNVKVSGECIAARIRQIVEETGCEKVNIIAHSKGGLDVKYAVAKTGIAPYVASVTTINTPHGGCEYAEHLLNLAPDKAKGFLSYIANRVFKHLGDKDPDVLSAVEELTCTNCRNLEIDTADFDFAENGIYTRSVGSGMTFARSGILPLNLASKFIDRYDGPNDGLVGQASFRWGEDYIFLNNGKRRGISHGDMIDITRSKVPGFDVCAFYVGLVNDLRQRGL